MKILGKPSEKDRTEASQHFQVFVGDLTYEVDNQVLRDAFAVFGNISLVVFETFLLTD